MISVEEAAQRAVEYLALAINTFSINRDRDLVPPDLYTDEDESCQDFTLVNLCCKEVTRNTTFLKEISAYLPINRYPALMKEAIRQDCRESASFLISVWPSAIISISEVAPGFLDASRILVPQGPGFGIVGVVAKGLNLLIELFLDLMKNTSSSMLRVLDLRGLYLAEKVLTKLIDGIISCSSNTPVNYHFIIDCEVKSNDMASLLTSLLEVPRDIDRLKAYLHFNKLDLSCLDEIISWKLLTLVDPTELIGLWMPPVISPNFSSFVLKKFLSLTALDISLTEPFFSQSKSKTLPLSLTRRLRRLALRGVQNDFSEIIPTSILQELEYLDIRNCHPEEKIADDVRYLSSVPLRLQELYLSGFNIIKFHLDWWRIFLRSLAPTLRMFRLAECFKNDNNFEYMVKLLLQLINLRYLKLDENRLTMKTLLEHATKLGSLPKLKIIVLPYKYTREELMNNNLPDDDPNNLKLEDVEKKFATEKSPSVFVEWSCRYSR